MDANSCDGTFTAETKDTIKLSQPIDFMLTTTHSAEDAYDRVLSYAGASLHRDSFDDLMVSDTRDGVATYTGSGLSKGFVNSQDDNRPSDASADWSPWPTLATSTAPTDTDGDGMPDSWETANNLNPNDPDDGKAKRADGYTNLEAYLNSIVADITEAQNLGGTQLESGEFPADAPTVSSYVIAPETSNGDWTFTNGCKISTEKDYQESSKCGIQSIKYSNGVTYTIHLPEGVTVSTVDFQGFTNLDNEEGYLSQLNGKSFGVNDYVFPSRTGGKAVSHSIALDTPANEVTFKFVKQIATRITLTPTSATSVRPVPTVSPSDEKTYDLGGRRATKGLVISRQGKRIAK